MYNNGHIFCVGCCGSSETTEDAKEGIKSPVDSSSTGASTDASASDWHNGAARSLTDGDDSTGQVSASSFTTQQHSTHHEHLRPGAEAAQLPPPRGSQHS